MQGGRHAHAHAHICRCARTRRVPAPAHAYATYDCTSNYNLEHLLHLHLHTRGRRLWHGSAAGRVSHRHGKLCTHGRRRRCGMRSRRDAWRPRRVWVRIRVRIRVRRACAWRDRHPSPSSAPSCVPPSLAHPHAHRPTPALASTSCYRALRPCSPEYRAIV